MKTTIIDSGSIDLVSGAWFAERDGVNIVPADIKGPGTKYHGIGQEAI